MRDPKSTIQWAVLIPCVLGVVAIGSLSGLANAGQIDTWYVDLNKPFFNPPDWIFGPVWTVLYMLMGIGLYWIYKSSASPQRTSALRWFALQLALNFVWSFLFFYFQSPGLALIEILLLWIAILMMILTFGKISPKAARIQIPYLLWVSFATVLNASIWWLNR